VRSDRSRVRGVWYPQHETSLWQAFPVSPSVHLSKFHILGPTILSQESFCIRQPSAIGPLLEDPLFPFQPNPVPPPKKLLARSGLARFPFPVPPLVPCQSSCQFTKTKPLGFGTRTGEAPIRVTVVFEMVNTYLQEACPVLPSAFPPSASRQPSPQW
jgi:hypothetical protein